jgi:hypothetical protein
MDPRLSLTPDFELDVGFSLAKYRHNTPHRGRYCEECDSFLEGFQIFNEVSHSSTSHSLVKPEPPTPDVRSRRKALKLRYSDYTQHKCCAAGN